MDLTDEQRAVIELESGRHLVLAPPGSGKTEMLSRRILRAVEGGVSPAAMLCATFTNRAAYEMRERVSAEKQGLDLPDVGNIHHFCFRFLISVGRIPRDRHVLDEAEQLDFIREVVDVLQSELDTRSTADDRRFHGVSVLKRVKGVVNPRVDGLNVARIDHLREFMDRWFANWYGKKTSPYREFLAAVLIARQRRIGIPRRFIPAMPTSMIQFDQEGVISAMERAYTSIKRRFSSADFDDLVNETYLYLSEHHVSEDRRYTWVQLDEVQDLNPLQWFIVNSLTAENSVSVYFGDTEQSIFSFLGADETILNASVKDCEKHYFSKNFRTTPLLLEILMRYSISTLRSEWMFLPEPSDLDRACGLVEMAQGTSVEAVMSSVSGLLDSGKAENVAVLVRKNSDADIFEEPVRGSGYSYAKVSGVDLFSTVPMRDFMAFVSLFLSRTSKVVWTRLVLRFSGTIFKEPAARYFVRGMFAAGFDPLTLLGKDDPVPVFPRPGDRRSVWAWSNRRTLRSLHRTLKPMYAGVPIGLPGPTAFVRCYELFCESVFCKHVRYELHELWPERFGPENDGRLEEKSQAIEHAKERIDRFLRYVGHVYAGDVRPFGKLLTEDWEMLSKLKEADLLVGDERIVISTVHKAKGRQFDAVVVPDVKAMLNGEGSNRDELERLLYVAMSRAKRHLFLFGAEEDVPALACMRECFRKDYIGYYRRRAASEDISSDWMFQWEELARCCREGAFPEKFVLEMLRSEQEPLIRMALRVIRQCPDESRRISLLGSLVDNRVANTADEAGMPILPMNCVDMLVSVIGTCMAVDREMLGKLRLISLVSDSSRVQRAFLVCLLTGKITDDGALTDALGDLVYVRDGNIRFDAAAALADRGCSRWLNVIHGVASDFRRIADVPDPEHEAVVRRLVSCSHSEGYTRELRAIIRQRALRW